MKGWGRRILLPLWQGVYTPLGIFYLISKKEERMILLKTSQGLYTPFVIFYLISSEGDENITPNNAGGGHPPIDTVPNIKVRRE